MTGKTMYLPERMKGGAAGLEWYLVVVVVVVVPDESFHFCIHSVPTFVESN